MESKIFPRVWFETNLRDGVWTKQIPNLLLKEENVYKYTQEIEKEHMKLDIEVSSQSKSIVKAEKVYQAGHCKKVRFTSPEDVSLGDCFARCDTEGTQGKIIYRTYASMFLTGEVRGSYCSCRSG